jgi:hypothetical protein
MDVSKPEGVALGGVASLQALLTALGASNGGLTAVLVNERIVAILGIGAVLLGFAITLFALTLERGNRLRHRGISAGALCLVLGLFGTAYAAIVAPSIAGKPKISVAVVPGKQLTYKASVKTTGLRRGTIFRIEVNGLRERGTTYQSVEPVLYQAQVGPDSSGEIDIPLEIPIPVGVYDDIGIQAWTGETHGPCDQLARERGATGCVVVRVKGLGSPTAAATKRAATRRRR